MKNILIDLIDFEKVTILLEGFNKTTGFAIAIFDLEGNVLSKSGWRQICTEFHRVHPETSKKCKISDIEITGKLDNGEKYCFHNCLNGLVDVAVPIVINREHIANLFTGQFFFEKPDRNFFIQQAEEYKFDTTKYLDALDEVPVVSEEKVITAMDFLLNIIQLITEMTSQKLEQAELNTALEKSEERFRLLYNNSPDMYVSVSPDDASILLCNDTLLKETGYSREEVVGSPIFKMYHDDCMADVRKAFDQFVETGEVKNKELILKRKDGSKIEVSLNAYGVRDKSGKVIYSMSSWRDTSELKQTEKALKESEEYFRILIENSSDVISILNDKGIVTYESPSHEKVLGYKTDKLIGENIFGLVHPDDRERVSMQFINLLKRSNGAEQVNFRFLHKDGTWIYIEGTGTNLLKHPKIKGIVVNYRDVTERKRADDKLKESEERFRSIVEQSPLSTQMFTPDGMTVQVNRAYENLWGITLDDLKGYNILEDQQLESLGIMSYIQGAFSGEAASLPVAEYDTVKSLGTGKKMWVQARIYPVKDNAENIDKIVLIHEDITQRRQDEEVIKNQAAKWQTTFNAMTDSVSIIDMDGKISQYNAATLSLFNINEEDIKEKKCFELVHRTKDFFNGCPLHRMKESHQPESMIFKEKERWLEVNVDPIFNSKNELTGAVHVVSDITERKQTEVIIRENEDKYRTLFESSATSIWLEDFSDIKAEFDTLNKNGVKDFRKYYEQHPEEVVRMAGLIKVVDANQSSIELMGAKDKETLIKSIPSYFTEESLVVFREELIALAQGKDRFISEIPVVNQLDKKLYLGFSLAIPKQSINSLDRIIFSFYNITERKQNEAEILRYTGELKMLELLSREISGTLSLDELIPTAVKGIMDTVKPDSVFFFIRENNKLILKEVAPKKAMESLGEVPEHKVGECLCGLAVLQNQTIYSKDINTDLRCTWNECKQAGFRSFAALPLKKGEESIGVVGLASYKPRDFQVQSGFLETLVNAISLNINNALLHNEVSKHSEELEQRVNERTNELSNSQAELLNIVEDLNEQSIELEKSTHLLEAKNKELETFTYSVSHDLKAPLRGIDGYSKLLQDAYKNQLDEDSNTFLSNIRESALKMNDLINNLLEYSRLERSQERLGKIRIKHLINSIVSIYRKELDAGNFSLDINVDDIEIEADSKGLSIALRNLIENSIKFTAGSLNPTITIGMEENSKTWTISVKDNGIGFDMKYKQKIFDIFQRLHRAEDFPGTGIGLAMVNKAMQRMNGLAWVVSSPGNGSAFYLEIPKSL